MPTIPTFVNVKAGDAVTVRIHNGAAVVVGVEGGGDRMAALIEQANQTAEQAAQEARQALEADDQHFFTDSNGAHVSTVEGSTTGDGVKAVTVNSGGVVLQDSGKPMASFTPSGTNFYDGDETVASYNKSGAAFFSGGESTAVFGPNGSVIGRVGGENVTVTPSSIDINVLAQGSGSIILKDDANCGSMTAYRSIDQANPSVSHMTTKTTVSNSSIGLFGRSNYGLEYAAATTAGNTYTASIAIEDIALDSDAKPENIKLMALDTSGKEIASATLNVFDINGDDGSLIALPVTMTMQFYALGATRIAVATDGFIKTSISAFSASSLLVVDNGASEQIARAAHFSSSDSYVNCDSFSVLGNEVINGRLDVGGSIYATGGGQQELRLRNKNVNARSNAANPESVAYLGLLKTSDANGDTVSNVQTWVGTGGANTINVGTRKLNGSGTSLVNNYVRLYAYADRAEVAMSHPSAWRNAMLPVSTATPTAASGWNSTLTVVKRGNVCQLQGTVSSKTGYTSSGTVVQVATIPAGFRPAEIVNLLSGVTGLYKGRIYVNSNGALSIGNVCQGSTYLNNSTGNITLGATWVCAE